MLRLERNLPSAFNGRAAQLAGVPFSTEGLQNTAPVLHCRGRL